ncbi:hypothetical protein B0T10DRAFT_463214 [Thelonectria olida]|uniref:Uncharacterized protein n=1 Tax=Thelonectria olida TaxID=1576542 RepID=A0A9P9ANY6_9HYPO|nr:hypothetical protein B0T10DRAFT_463214 [Thelonectria olida]
MECKLVEFTYNDYKTIFSSALYGNIAFFKNESGSIHGVPGLEEPIKKIQHHVDSAKGIITKLEWQEFGRPRDYQLLVRFGPWMPFVRLWRVGDKVFKASASIKRDDLGSEIQVWLQQGPARTRLGTVCNCDPLDMKSDLVVSSLVFEFVPDNLVKCQVLFCVGHKVLATSDILSQEHVKSPLANQSSRKTRWKKAYSASELGEMHLEFGKKRKQRNIRQLARRFGRNESALRNWFKKMECMDNPNEYIAGLIKERGERQNYQHVMYKESTD